MSKARSITTMMLLVFTIFLCPLQQGHAEHVVEQGITPSQPYAIWLNINKIIIDYAALSGVNNNAFKQLNDLEVAYFEGKVPEDVFNKVGDVTELFLSMSSNNFTSHGDSVESIQVTTLASLRNDNDEVVPVMVFFRSFVLLDIISQDLTKLDCTGILFSQYFKIIEYEDKIPSDVYGLVDLAYRRLQIIKAAKEGL